MIRYRAIKVLMRNGRFDLALVHLERRLTETPGEPEAMRLARLCVEITQVLKELAEAPTTGGVQKLSAAKRARYWFYAWLAWLLRGLPGKAGWLRRARVRLSAKAEDSLRLSDGNAEMADGAAAAENLAGETSSASERHVFWGINAALLAFLLLMGGLAVWLCIREPSLQRLDIKKVERLALEGNPTAQYRLGLCYWQGIHLWQDRQEALTWLERAARGGHGKAAAVLRSLESTKGAAPSRAEGAETQ